MESETGKTSGSPTVFIIAGPNGAGKTTFAMSFLPTVAGCTSFVNADEIAKGLSPLNPEAELVHATRLFLATVDQKIEERKDFAFETTLSGRTYLNKIKDWRAAGWRVVMIYLYLSSAEVSANRVRQRVAQGGHNIPLNQIYRRYPRSLENLFEYGKVCDRTYCLDNSDCGAKIIFEMCRGCEPEVKNQDLYNELLKEITG